MLESDPFVRSLRDAADPRVEPDAAARIAEAAWRRAADLRGARTIRWRRFRRAGGLAAAAALFAAAVYGLRGTEPAFAVEGDPVMVAKGGEWKPSRTVCAGAVVRVPGRRS